MTAEAPAPRDAPRHVLILGAGFAGLECARRLANDRRFVVTLVDRTNHHLFQPLLYQVATASLAGPDIARSIRQILEGARNVTVLMDEIVSLHPAEHYALGLSGHRFSYDYLVLAVGARTSFFGNDKWEQNTLGLKTLADAQAIRRQVLSNLERAELSEDPAEQRKLMTIVIVGGGPTGVELTGAFVDLIHRSLRTNFRRINTRKLRVILIEGSERILEPYDESQSEYARQRLLKIGAEVLTNTRVVDVLPQKVILQSGESIEAAAIIWAAGVRANSLTADLGLPRNRAGNLTPELDLSLPGNPEIFVTGDIVSMQDAAGVRVPALAPAATQMGKHVALLLKEELRLEGTRFAAQKLSLRPKFTYFDKGTMAIIGKNHAVMQAGRLKARGFIAWLAWLFIHILLLIGFRNKIAVLLGWAYAYVRNNPEARIIINPPTAFPPSGPGSPPSPTVSSN
jgi:NADH dehydrogenase